MDLRKYEPSEEQVAELRGLIGYQPFRLSEDVQTGVGDMWANRTDLKSLARNEASTEDWDRFITANNRMSKMYNDWIDAICERVGDVSEMTAIDVASNAGFFPFRFREKGVKRSIAYDMNQKMGRTYELLNAITGLDVEFCNVRYDQMTHTIPDAQQGDIVVASAIMCHLSDPLYFLNFLGSIARKALLVFSTIDDDKRFRITYNEPGKFYPENPFPVCFDNMTTVSRPLLEFSLREMGFSEIMELEYQEDWLPMSWYRQYKAILAIR